MNITRQKTRIALFATALATCTAMPAGAQTLDAVRDAVRTDPHAGETREESRNRERAAGDECDDDDSFFAEFLAELMFRPLGWFLFGDPGETELDTAACGRQRFMTWYPLREWDGYFARYPYADGYDRFVMPEGHVPVPSRLWSGRVAFEYGDDFDRIDRWGGRFLLEGRPGIGLDGEVNLYRERLLAGGHDRLAIGDLNLLYRVNETNRTQWRIGIGMNWLDDHDTDLGLNFTLRGDWQPGWPLVMSGEVDFGTLGHAWTFHGNASLGIMVRRCEFFVGYDYRTIDSIELEGPMVGLRVWF